VTADRDHHVFFAPGVRRLPSFAIWRRREGGEEAIGYILLALVMLV
jgi:hypothetical protein